MGIARWRHDKPASEADTLASARALLERREPQAKMIAMCIAKCSFWLDRACQACPGRIT